MIIAAQKLFVETFNQADGTVPASLWGAVTGYPGILSTLSNQAAGSAGGRGAYNKKVLKNNQYVEATGLVWSAVNSTFIAVGLCNLGTGTADEYQGYLFRDGAANKTVVLRKIGASPVTIGTAAADGTETGIRVKKVGTRISLETLKGSIWTEIHFGTNTTNTKGYAGLYLIGTAARANDFKCGDL